MIEIKPIDSKFKNADAETRRQLWEINVAEALSRCISNEDQNNSLGTLSNALIELIGKTAREVEARAKTRESEMAKKLKDLESAPKPSGLFAKLLGL